MIDPATIIALLAGGAIAEMKGLGGQAAKDTYAGLKRVLVDGYEFAAARLLEKKPTDEAVLKAAEDDIPAKATTDPAVEKAALALESALAKVPADAWQRAGVVIEGLIADRDIQLGRVDAGAHGVTVRLLRAMKGDIRIGDVKG